VLCFGQDFDDVVICKADCVARGPDYRVRARDARIRVTPDHQNQCLSSTRNNSTTMAPIDDALAAINALELGEKLVY